MAVTQIGTADATPWLPATAVSETIINKIFLDKKLLKYAKPKLIHSSFGKPATVPKGMRQYEWHFYDIYAVSATPETAYLLAEGVTPTDSIIPTVAIKTANPSQFGAFILGTDLLEATGVDPVVAEFTEKLGVHSGMSLDRIVRNVLVAGTTIQYAGPTATSVVTVNAADIINYDELVEAVRTLKTNNVEPCKNGRFCAVIHPFTWATLMRDPDFKEAVTFGQKDNLFEGKLGTFLGVDFYETSEAFKNAAGGAGAIDVYYTLIFGAEAFGTVDLAMLKLETIFKAAGSAKGSDYLNQVWSIAWKASHATTRLNETYFLQIRHAVA